MKRTQVPIAVILDQHITDRVGALEAAESVAALIDKTLGRTAYAVDADTVEVDIA